MSATRERFEQKFEEWLGKETCEVHYDNSAEKNARYGYEAGWRAATADMDELLGALRDDEDVLTNCAQIIDVTKIEWGNAWSEWDQSVRDGITRCLLRIEAVLARYGKLEGRG